MRTSHPTILGGERKRASRFEEDSFLYGPEAAKKVISIATHIDTTLGMRHIIIHGKVGLTTLKIFLTGEWLRLKRLHGERGDYTAEAAQKRKAREGPGA